MFASYYQYCVSIRSRTCLGGDTCRSRVRAWLNVEDVAGGTNGNKEKGRDAEEKSPRPQFPSRAAWQEAASRRKSVHRTASFFLSVCGRTGRRETAEEAANFAQRQRKEGREEEQARVQTQRTTGEKEVNPPAGFRFQLGQIGERTVLKRQRGRIAYNYKTVI